MFNFITNKEKFLKDFKICVSTTCVGNVAQLTTDLLVENLKMEKVADLWHDSIPPLIGLSAFEHIKDKTTSAAELYVNEEKKLACLQIRTPLTAPLMGDFFQKLADFAKSEQIKQVLILTASYAYEKHSVQGSDFMFKSNKERDFKGIPDLNKSFTPKILGGGYAMKLYEVLNEKEIDTVVLYKYVSEGDNIPDAVTLFIKLNQIIQFMEIDSKNEKMVKCPVSWKYLFGNRPPTEIY
uniref:Proteasome assembly chaperone 2 n=1 Tax=Culicoides sonorensis TaxID=179676 RepID=A0A336KWR8_CULSO